MRHPDHGGFHHTRLHVRYRRLLLDEFRTPTHRLDSPCIAAARPGFGSDEVPVSPGHLFLVGDEAVIYRFRRADISVFLAAGSLRGPRRLVALTTNFRTGAPVIAGSTRPSALLAEPAALSCRSSQAATWRTQ